MATSLLLACGLNEHKLPATIHLSEESDVDGSFLISSMLGQRLRVQNSGVILICLQQTFQHYLNAGMRLGYNLNMFNEKSLRAYEPIQDLMADDSSLSTTGCALNSKILEYIRNVCAEKFSEKTSISIIIDNLSILLNMGETTKSILSCYKNLQQFVGTLTEVGKAVTIITKLNNCELFDVMDNNLICSSDLHIKIVKLKSGSFKEVDGRLIITKEQLIGLCEIVKNEKNILYKVNDRNIKIFNPGEVGIKA